MSWYAVLPAWLVKPTEPRQILSTNWTDRQIINKQDVNLFCWQRAADIEIVAYLQTIIALQPRPIVVSTNITNVAEAIATAKSAWQTNPTLGAEKFWADVTAIASDFLKLSEDGTGVIHVRTVGNDSCTKYHVDGYRLRLFTTYIGPGTEWLPEKAVNRTALGTENIKIAIMPELTQRMKPFEVGILKGQLKMGRGATPGIVHKSPTVSDIEALRVILRIDIP